MLPILQKLKNVYLLWHDYHRTLPKTNRYSLGQRLDDLLIQIIEAVACATFLPKQEKQQPVRLAITKLDTFKVLLLVLWESKSLDNKKYAALTLPLQEIGKMLGGWNGQLLKQNSPLKSREK